MLFSTFLMTHARSHEPACFCSVPRGGAALTARHQGASAQTTSYSSEHPREYVPNPARIAGSACGRTRSSCSAASYRNPTSQVNFRIQLPMRLSPERVEDHADPLHRLARVIRRRIRSIRGIRHLLTVAAHAVGQESRRLRPPMTVVVAAWVMVVSLRDVE